MRTQNEEIIREEARLGAIREEARLLARENKQSEPSITRIYWFSNPEEVRLIELDTLVPRSLGDAVEPFYFPASAEHNLPAPSGIALIHPDDYERLALPIGWGTWEDAEELEIVA